MIVPRPGSTQRPFDHESDAEPLHHQDSSRCEWVPYLRPPARHSGHKNVKMQECDSVSLAVNSLSLCLSASVTAAYCAAAAAAASQMHQCTSPTASIALLMSARGGVCVPARQRRWLFHFDSSQHNRGSRFPSRRCPRVEQFTVVCHMHRRHCRLSNDI